MRREPMNPKLMLVLITTGWLASCSSRVPDTRSQFITAVPAAMINSTSIPTPTITLSRPTPLSTQNPSGKTPVWRISDAPYTNFGWLPESDMVLYGNRCSSDVWSYDVAAKRNELYPTDFPWKPDAKMLAALPPTARAIEVSPSGGKTLYTISDTGATPTSFPDGEMMN
jgi:hypothetical protein